jgi:hypothetical protein
VTKELLAYQTELKKIFEEQSAIAQAIVAQGGPIIEGF